MAATVTAALAHARAGAAPAGLNPAQLKVWARLEAARFALALLPPLDPDVLDADRRAEQAARLNGNDS